MLSWCDIGVNLFSQQFDSDRTDVLQRAAAANVNQLILIGSDITESQQNLAFCQQNPGCFTTAGVHPHQAAHVVDNWQHQLRDLLDAGFVIAVGECGLDFNRDFSPRPKQQQVFAAQLELAKAHAKPVYLHERDAFTTQLAMLKEQQISHGVAHCFTGDSLQLKAYLDLGLYIGITGWLCDERRGDTLRRALQYLPLDRILLETDAPYLLPRDLLTKPANRRNEPAYLPHIAKTVAHQLQLDLQQLAQQTQANCQRLFQLGPALLSGAA